MALHTTYDSQGNEYIMIEFAYRPPKMPLIVPSDVPREITDMIEASKDMVRVIMPPQLQTHLRSYANRLILFLTLDEFESLHQKYTIGDEFKFTINPDGGIKSVRV
jgi:hypothetical protein